MGKSSVDIWEGAKLMGALKTKQINVNNVIVERKLSWGLSNEMT